MDYIKDFGYVAMSGISFTAIWRSQTDQNTRAGVSSFAPIYISQWISIGVDTGPWQITAILARYRDY